MSSDLLTIGPDATVIDAARVMQEGQVRHLPVLSDGQIAGIVSMRDLFAALVDASAEEADVVVVRSGTHVLVVAE